MSYALAVDVGTSFTAAAVVRFHQGASPVPESLPLGSRGAAVPSVLYFPEEGPVLVGEAAERRALDTPERVVREFKRRIGDDVPIILGTLALQPEDVFATLARWVADRAAEREGGPPSAVFLTHPAAWGSHRLSVIRSALAAHGLENVTLLPEPQAAALHYASQVRVEEGSTIAVYDLGGGTFDTAVLRKSGSSRFELLGRPEGLEDLGGADFDAAVFGYVAAHAGSALDDLDPTDPAVLGALARLRRECVEAKEALSVDSEASIPVLLPGAQQQVRLVRSEFEALIEEPVRETVAALEHSLAQLHVEPADLSAVLLIGGSSRIPLVAQLVSEQLDRPIAVDADPKSSICLGAAVAALLAQAAAAEAAAAAETAMAGTETEADEAAPAVEPPSLPPAPTAPGMPSWSRKYATAAGGAAGHAAARGAPHGKGGAHAPKPTVRVTAVAAAAALLTVLTATAAQSPDGFGNLTAMFVPQAGASTTGGSAGGSAGGAGGTEAAGAAGAAAAAAPQPLAGVEASARPSASQESGHQGSAAPAAEKTTGIEGASGPGGANTGEAAAGGAAPVTPLSGSGGATAGGAIVPDTTGMVTATPTGVPQPATTPTPAPTATDPGTTSPATPSPATPSPGPTGSGSAAPTTSETPTPVSGTSTATSTGSPTGTADPVMTPTQLDAQASPTPQATPLESTATPTGTATAADTATSTETAASTAPITTPGG